MTIKFEVSEIFSRFTAISFIFFEVFRNFPGIFTAADRKIREYMELTNDSHIELRQQMCYTSSGNYNKTKLKHLFQG